MSNWPFPLRCKGVHLNTNHLSTVYTHLKLVLFDASLCQIKQDSYNPKVETAVIILPLCVSFNGKAVFEKENVFFLSEGPFYVYESYEVCVNQTGVNQHFYLCSFVHKHIANVSKYCLGQLPLPAILYRAVNILISLIFLLICHT